MLLTNVILFADVLISVNMADDVEAQRSRLEGFCMLIKAISVHGTYFHSSFKDSNPVSRWS